MSAGEIAGLLLTVALGLFVVGYAERQPLATVAGMVLFTAVVLWLHLDRPGKGEG